jgi:hypothetical protein
MQPGSTTINQQSEFQKAFSGLTPQEQQAYSQSNPGVVAQYGGGSGGSWGSGAYDPLQYGAAGRGEFAGQTGVGGRTASGGMGLDIPMSEIGNYLGESNYIIPSGKYKGMTVDAAEKKQAQTKELQLGQMSALASYAFTPETMSGVKNAVDNFKLSIDRLNYPFKSDGTRKDELGVILSSSANDLAKPFNTPDEFYAALQHPDMQKQLSGYFNAGGDASTIASAIEKKNQTQGFNMPTMDFLSTNELMRQGAQGADPLAVRRAEQDLFSEGELAQNRVAQIANIPKELMSNYFGDAGLYQMQITRHNESIRRLEDKIRSETTTVREKGRLEISKVKNEMDRAIASTEEKRITAKNYVTGMLAKLGALKTTGEAPMAIARLDQKYEQQKGEIQMKGQEAIRSIEVEVNSRVRDIEDRADDAILKIKNDLSKSAEDMVKDIMKAQQTAEKDIYSVQNSFASKFRTTLDKYEKQIQTISTDYIGKYFVEAGGTYQQASVSQILEGKAQKPIANASGVPGQEVDRVVQAILTGINIDQLYAMFPHIAPSALRSMWNQMTNKNTGKEEKVSSPSTVESDSGWRN